MIQDISNRLHTLANSLRSLAVLKQFERAKKVEGREQTPKPRGAWERDTCETTRNALVPGRRPRKFPCQNLIETIVEPLLTEGFRFNS